MDDGWYLMSGDNVSGPHSLDELRDKASVGFAMPDDWVKQAGHCEWVKLDSIIDRYRPTSLIEQKRQRNISKHRNRISASRFATGFLNKIKANNLSRLFLIALSAVASLAAVLVLLLLLQGAGHGSIQGDVSLARRSGDSTPLIGERIYLLRSEYQGSELRSMLGMPEVSEPRPHIDQEIVDNKVSTVDFITKRIAREVSYLENRVRQATYSDKWKRENELIAIAAAHKKIYSDLAERKTTTDNGGAFSFADVPSGEYVIVAWHERREGSLNTVVYYVFPVSVVATKESRIVMNSRDGVIYSY